ncbi:hypothetical protein [Asaia bogorensis]|uniref:hypothetical protein n=1 Tax=Asaia bogorensis TaxID=91915 RepID=UPI000EFD359B|nr:hypothetical protein [Asaia bogorensis]
MPTTPAQRPWRYALTDLTGLLFAALWSMRGLAALGIAPSHGLIITVSISLPLAWGFLRRDITHHDPEIVHDHQLARRTRRARVVLLVAAGMVLSAVHRPDLMLVVAGLVIGASYLPLGRAMHEPVHIYTGVGILFVTAASLFLNQPLHSVVAGLGTASACWVGALCRLMRSRQISSSGAEAPIRTIA